MSLKRSYLMALGANLPSNVGSPIETISAGLAALMQDGVVLGQVSRMFQTPCFPVGAGPDYVNAAAQIFTDLAPSALLDKMHEIEAAMGRQRVQRWGGRTLDLDLLAMGGAVCPDLETYQHWQQLAPQDQVRFAPEQLILPHPRLHERAFVLIPLLDVAPDWVHPVFGLSITQICANLAPEDVKAVVPL